VARPTPASAPLQERSLEPGERAAYEAVSASAGADGAEALYFLGLDLASGGDWRGAGLRWQKDVQTHPGTGWDRLAQYKMAEALERTGDGPRAFVQYQALLEGPALADLPERARRDCLRLLNTLDEARLRALSGYARPEFASPLRIRLLELDLDAGRLDEVRQGVDDYLRSYPTGPGLDRIEALSQKLEASVPVDRHSIGLLVPREGPLAAFGTQVLQGAELALDAANAGRAEADRVHLIVADEGGGTAAAVEAARSLIEKNQVIGLLGPLNSESALALLPLLAAHRTPMLSPSATRPDLADVSPWFFRNTLSPERQASAMADYAVVARHLTRVASLSPDNYYGSVSAQAFAARVRELGGVVAASLTYAPGTRDFREAMLAMGGIDPGDGKNAELDEKRDQQSRVDEASNALGKVLLDRAQNLTPPASTAGVTETPKPRLLVVDFAQDTACAEINAGRAFADRFARTLVQLEDVDVVGPQAAERWWKPLTPTVEALSTVQLAQAGKAAGADFVLMGGAAGVAPDPARQPNKRLFSLTAQLLDVATGTIIAQKSFGWSKYQAPPSNGLGLQALFIPSSAVDVALVAPDMVFFDLRVPLLGSDQWDRPELREHLPELEGAVFTDAYWPDSPDEAVKRFDDAYRLKYAAKPGLLAAQAYDAAALMAMAIHNGATDRASLRGGLARIENYTGVSGRTSFGGHQDAVKRPAFVAVQASALHLLREQ